jgi:ribosomal protein S19
MEQFLEKYEDGYYVLRNGEIVEYSEDEEDEICVIISRTTRTISIVPENCSLGIMIYKGRKLIVSMVYDNGSTNPEPIDGNFALTRDIEEFLKANTDDFEAAIIALCPLVKASIMRMCKTRLYN